eukprot:TRINITY_DN7801_c0_g1_i2.p1 TRINITY_DN7801_c0_g1~~TRINITY_DN7801_c0_g1_i2.p1  ORF type:complete len:523 (-),score=93.23 TRINITY_DN7801_c0_g1_i2:194-1762(-)
MSTGNGWMEDSEATAARMGPSNQRTLPNYEHQQNHQHQQNHESQQNQETIYNQGAIYNQRVHNITVGGRATVVGRMLRGVYSFASLVALLAGVVLTAEYGVAWVIQDQDQRTREVFFFYFTFANDAINLVVFNAAIWCCYCRVFSPSIVLPHISTIGIRYLAAHMTLYCIRYLMRISFLRPIYYCLIITHFFHMGHKVKKTLPHLLQSDSLEAGLMSELVIQDTALAMSQYFALFSVISMVFVFAIVPLFYSLSFWGRVILRSVGYPMTVSIFTLAQYMLFSQKSMVVMSRIWPLLCFLNTTHVVFGRLMINSGKSLSEDLVFVIFSMLVELLGRITVRYREKAIRMILSRCMNLRKPIPAFTNVSTAVVGWTDQHQHQRGIPLDAMDTPSINDLPQQTPNTILMTESERRVYHSTIVVEDMLCECQVIIILPIILFLMHPFQHSYAFPKISTPQGVVASIALQLSIEFFGDVLALIYEVNVLKLEFRPPQISCSEVAYRTLFLLVSIYWAMIPFTIEYEIY